MHPKAAEGIANSVDPDQTAPLGSALSAKICLSENLGILQYFMIFQNSFWIRGQLSQSTESTETSTKTQKDHWIQTIALTYVPVLELQADSAATVSGLSDCLLCVVTCLPLFPELPLSSWSPVTSYATKQDWTMVLRCLTYVVALDGCMHQR